MEKVMFKQITENGYIIHCAKQEDGFDIHEIMDEFIYFLKGCSYSTHTIIDGLKSKSEEMEAEA